MKAKGTTGRVSANNKKASDGLDDDKRIEADQFLAIIDQLPALISYVDAKEVYRFVNKGYITWFGLDRGSIIGRTLKQVLGTIAYKQVKPRIDSVLAGETVHFDELIIYQGIGEKFVSVSYFPDRGPNDEVRGFYVVVNDLSSIKNAEQVIAGIRDRIEVVTESFTDHAILSTDVEGRIETWNTGAENIFRYNESEIIGLSIEILFTPEDRTKGMPLKEMTIARTKGRALDERWHIRKDGSRFFASGIMSPLYEGGRLSGYAKIATDLTEKKKIAEALQSAHDQMEVRVGERTRALAEANEKLRAEYEHRTAMEARRTELLQKLLSIQEDERRRISRDIHDQFGQLITGLRLKIASLEEYASVDEGLKKRIDRIREVAADIDSQISKIAWELRPLVLDEFGMVEAMRNLLNGWSQHHAIHADYFTSGLKNFTLSEDIESHLYRIAQEALSNIAKHAGASRVSVILERSDESVILIIEDNGAGFVVHKDAAPDNSRQKLGLVGMRERAHIVGGEVEIESELGKGTTVFVRVPIEFRNDQREAK
ncbi:PAS domain S-box protein [soil metagenome]